MSCPLTVAVIVPPPEAVAPWPLLPPVVIDQPFITALVPGFSIVRPAVLFATMLSVIV